METKGDKMENRILVSILRLNHSSVSGFISIICSDRFLLHVDYLYLLLKFQLKLTLISTTLTCNPLRARNYHRYNNHCFVLRLLSMLCD